MTDELKAAVERVWKHISDADNIPPGTPVGTSLMNLFLRALADEPVVVATLKPDETLHPFDITRDILKRLAEIVK